MQVAIDFIILLSVLFIVTLVSVIFCFQAWRDAKRQAQDAVIERDIYNENYVNYIKLVEPVVWYLAKREQEHEKVTDDGLKTAIHYSRWEYDAWLEEVIRLSHYDEGE